MSLRRLLVGVLALCLLPVAPAAYADEGGWVRPVGGSVVRAYDPPISRFGSGHLGVDFAAAPGTDVRAAGRGTVTFAGQVGGILHAVVQHAGGVRTSYSFLRSVYVRRFDEVAAGDIVGTTGGHGENHGGAAFHFGARSGDDYFDPMLLFDGVDLTNVVSLAPVGSPFFRLDPADALGIGGGFSSKFDAVGEWVSRYGGAAVGAITAVVGPLAAVLATVGNNVLQKLYEVASAHPLVRRARTAWTVLDLAFRFVREQADCNHDAPAANGEGGSGHRVMLVAGIETQADSDGRALDLSAESLGYEHDEVTHFSYAADGLPYTARDTYQPIIESAHRLAAQLRELQRLEPGREVDLIAHSQGGVVVLAFLELIYDRGDATYPPIGTVVTLASPLDGAPLATVTDDLQRDPVVGPLLEASDAADGAFEWWPVPYTDGQSVEDLSENSALMDQLANSELPGHIDLTTVGASLDLVVPGHAATTDGARHTIISAPLWAHSSILSDADALRAVRTALEVEQLPCRNLEAFVVAELAPPVITEITYEVGNLLEGPLPLP